MSGPRCEARERTNLDFELALSDVGERGSDRSEEEIVENARCVQGQNVQLLGHSEDHVKVRDREKLGRTGIEPFAACRRLATRTSPVPAGMPLNVLVAATVTLLPLPAEGGRSARANRAQCFPLHGSGAMSTTVAFTAGSHDRAEIALGHHGSVVHAVRQQGSDLLERADDLSHSLR